MLSCSIWFSAPSLWKDGGLENCCRGRVYGVDSAVHGTALSTPYTRLIVLSCLVFCVLFPHLASSLCPVVYSLF